jgi:hypothetical protein
MSSPSVKGIVTIAASQPVDQTVEKIKTILQAKSVASLRS